MARKAPWYAFLIVLCACGVLIIPKIAKTRRTQIIFLTALAIMGFLFVYPKIHDISPRTHKTYAHALDHRIVSPVVINQNTRRRGHAKTYRAPQKSDHVLR